MSGLNTAATLWDRRQWARVPASLLPEAVLAAVFVLAANTLLRPVVNRIQRQPLPEAFSEATYAINVVCQREQQAEVLDRLLLLLEQAQYPARGGPHSANVTWKSKPCCTRPRSMPESWMRFLPRWQPHRRAAGFWNASLEE